MSGNVFTRAILMMALCTAVSTGCGGTEADTQSQQPTAESLSTTEAAMATNFRCGPYTRTYFLKDASGNVTGIRCVKVVNNHSFAWYGEGRWGNAAYRHVGYAASDNFNGGVRFWGSLADIYGNGESYQGFYNQNLDFQASSPIDGPGGASIIQILSPFAETWYLAGYYDNVLYEPLPYEMSYCGNPNLNQMGVEGGSINHVRCLLDLKAGVNLPYAWVGKGKTASGQPYFHLGTGNFQLGGGWAASDLCLTPNHACNNFAFGSLSLTPLTYSRIGVTGAWNEIWYPF